VEHFAKRRITKKSAAVQPKRRCSSESVMREPQFQLFGEFQLTGLGPLGAGGGHEIECWQRNSGGDALRKEAGERKQETEYLRSYIQYTGLDSNVAVVKTSEQETAVAPFITRS
jgi:hypothetical protein